MHNDIVIVVACRITHGMRINAVSTVGRRGVVRRGKRRRDLAATSVDGRYKVNRACRTAFVASGGHAVPSCTARR